MWTVDAMSSGSSTGTCPATDIGPDLQNDKNTHQFEKQRFLVKISRGQIKTLGAHFPRRAIGSEETNKTAFNGHRFEEFQRTVLIR